MSDLRERCKAQHERMLRLLTIREDPTEDLVAFVVSEIGRAADEKLDATLPLCLYFDSEQDRAEFVDAVHAAKPGMIARRWPA